MYYKHTVFFSWCLDSLDECITVNPCFWRNNRGFFRNIVCYDCARSNFWAWIYRNAPNYNSSNKYTYIIFDNWGFSIFVADSYLLVYPKIFTNSFSRNNCGKSMLNIQPPACISGRIINVSIGGKKILVKESATYDFA